VGTEKGREILLDMYDAREEPARLSGLYGLGEIADDRALEYLEVAIKDPSASVRRRALMSLAHSGRRQAIDRLIQHLEQGEGSAKHMASRALEDCGDAAVDPLILALWSTDVDTRHYVIRSLGHIGTPRALQALLHILSLEAEEAYYDLVRLVKIQQLPHTAGVRLLSTTLAERVAQSKRNALQILHSAYGDRRGMRLILSNLNHHEPYVRSSAIEALEVRADSSVVSGILPLFEHANPKVTAEHGGSYFQLPSKDPLEVLFELAGDRSRWLRACALYALGQVGDDRAIPLLERKVSDSYELARLNAIEALGELAGSAGLPLLERAARKFGGREKQYADTASRKIRSRIAKAT
jgi:HEAT repeat protein